MAESRPLSAAAARLAATQSTPGSSTTVSMRDVSVELLSRAAAKTVHAPEVNVPCREASYVSHMDQAMRHLQTPVLTENP